MGKKRGDDGGRGRGGKEGGGRESWGKARKGNNDELDIVFCGVMLCVIVFTFALCASTHTQKFFFNPKAPHASARSRSGQDSPFQPRARPPARRRPPPPGP